jgi:DNA-directed RNA polymerase subunit RPC12/RpoP
MSTTARSIGCTACGGQFEIASPEARVVCPYCRHRQSLPAELRRELREFRERFRPEQERADEAVRHSSDWREVARGPGTLGPLGIVLLQAAVLAPIGLSILSKQLGWGFDPGIVAYASYAALLGVGFMVARSRRRPREARRVPRANLGMQHVDCPACGARNEYDPRQAAVACAYCESALFPSTAVLGQSLEAARIARRQALLDQYRAERAATARLALDARRDGAYSAARSMPVVVGFGVCFLLLGAMTSEVGKSLPDEPALYALWLLLPIAWAIVARRGARRQGRRKQLEAELAELAERQHGRLSTDVRDCVAWLDRYWAGPHPIRQVGNWYFVVSGSAGKHPVLAELNLEGLHYEPAMLEVLLSAWIPGVSDTEDDGAALGRVQRPFHEGLHQYGCSLEIRAAGLVAKRVLDSAAAARFEREPGSVAELEGIFRQLAGVAQQLGASSLPAQPMVQAQRVS